MKEVVMQRLKTCLAVALSGTATYAAFSYYRGNDKFYKNILMPVVHLLDAEQAHKLAIFATSHGLIPKSRYQDSKLLKTTLFDKQLSNPIGIAAGFDKDGEAIIGLKDIGFGFIEIGSVTPLPQPGNQKPRVFRLEADLAVINRYGFNSVGHDAVYKRLNKLRHADHLNYPVGINLGKNKTSSDPINDYVKGILKFGPLSDYLVINISSPNTPHLRDMQTKVALTALLKAVVKARDSLPQAQKPHIFLKLAPDLTDRDKKEIADVLKQKACKIDGLIISNTTIDRPAYLKDGNINEAGGLSGRPLKDVSTKMIADMYKLTNGMTIIGVGGVFTGEDAYEKIKAGAKAVQVYTGLIYEGPPIVTKIKRELATLLKADGYKNVEEAVGRDVKL